MTININVPIKLMIRLIRAAEKLADDYATVHAVELAHARTPPSTDRGRVWYQSDRELWEEEQKATEEIRDWQGEVWTDKDPQSVPPSQR